MRKIAGKIASTPDRKKEEKKETNEGRLHVNHNEWKIGSLIDRR